MANVKDECLRTELDAADASIQFWVDQYSWARDRLVTLETERNDAVNKASALNSELAEALRQERILVSERDTALAEVTYLGKLRDYWSNRCQELTAQKDDTLQVLTSRIERLERDAEVTYAKVNRILRWLEIPEYYQ